MWEVNKVISYEIINDCTFCAIVLDEVNGFYTVSEIRLLENLGAYDNVRSMISLIESMSSDYHNQIPVLSSVIGRDAALNDRLKEMNVNVIDIGVENSGFSKANIADFLVEEANGRIRIKSTLENNLFSDFNINVQSGNKVNVDFLKSNNGLNKCVFAAICKALTYIKSSERKF